MLPNTKYHFPGEEGVGVLSNKGYIGMCGPKGYGFSAILVINRVSINTCRVSIFAL